MKSVLIAALLFTGVVANAADERQAFLEAGKAEAKTAVIERCQFSESEVKIVIPQGEAIEVINNGESSLKAAYEVSVEAKSGHSASVYLTVTKLVTSAQTSVSVSIDSVAPPTFGCR